MVNTVSRSTIRSEAIRMVMEELTPMLMPSPLQTQMPKQTQEVTQESTQLVQELIPFLVRMAILRNRDTILEVLQLVP